ncbi:MULTISPECIES: glycosyltransferase [unclassified Ruminococcus]|uniref:glycosyltransferase n=1 Tax=unclassified Ruminococcus TaxID=2608920 RepID=UPI00210CFBAA|nr:MULTISPECIES: glycosyltransferase [unclassified Ruminococcus]MCQ4023111.1 glycosyltransferase [Ruminococcus sp. zg-924]MCQ4115118.1 glycosyltransferase [Ruminococcus sp. zg-921]
MVKDKEKNFVSAVVYVRNRENTVVDFLKKINGVFQEHFLKYEIICVNDASYDESAKKIKEFGEKYLECPLSIVNMGFFQGLEMSMNAGVDLSIGDFVFEFDSDIIDFDPSLIMDVYNHSLKGFDIVSTAANGKKRLTSKLFYKLFNKSAKTQYKLSTESFRILSRRAINRVHALSKTIPYRKALYANCGLKMDTIQYEPLNNARLESANKPSDARLETALDSLMLFTNIGYRASMILTVIMILATIGIGIYTILVFALGHPVPGFTTTMLVITGSFFGVFAILTIIIKYLSLLVNLIFKKQRYLVESIEKISK